MSPPVQLGVLELSLPRQLAAALSNHYTVRSLAQYHLWRMAKDFAGVKWIQCSFTFVRVVAWLRQLICWRIAKRLRGCGMLS